MTPIDEGASLSVKLLNAVKDLPLWLLAGVAAAIGIFLAVPSLSADLPKEGKAWVVFAAILSAVLTAVRVIGLGVQSWRSWGKAREARKTFYLTPTRHQCYWHSSKQPDDSIVTQISADFTAKNRTQAPLALLTARLINPRSSGEVLQDLVFVQGSSHRNDRIPASSTAHIHVIILIRGQLRNDPHETLAAVLGITDDEGNEQTVKVPLRGASRSAVQSVVTTAPAEAVYTMTDPIEKQLVSVLQSELGRYDKCGREVGGLGSVHVVYQGQAMAGVGGDSWTPNIPKNQSVVPNPEAATLQSDNLDAILVLALNFKSQKEREHLRDILLDRLDEKRGYLRVSYFIVCVLWKLGFLRDALMAAKARLPQGEIKEFGLSNVLMMMNGLLRYRHPDFTPEMLDDIEAFIEGMREHHFMIREKIAAIRVMRTAQRAS